MIKSLRDLEHIKNSRLPDIRLRTGNVGSNDTLHVLVCTGTGCTSSESRALIEEMVKQLKSRDLQHRVKVFKTGCFGFCKMGPIVMVHPGEIFYCLVEKEDVDELIESHFINGNVVERLLYQDERSHGVAYRRSDINFFRAQNRVVLRNCGLINPEDIGEYIAMDGYFALADVLVNKQPGEVIDIISASGLRGRGGGGFPVGRKWAIAAAARGDVKYVVCNADEGDPGAFMDRSILEGDPHSVLEAMTIAGYCIGAQRGYIYVRAEYPIAVDRLEIAIDEARDNGLLGRNIFGTDFHFDIDLRLGAGAFVCGEETALLRSAMGRRGEPRPRPPYPAECGLWGKPTLLNNVETFANIPLILRYGADWFASMGTEGSKGTKVFSLAGKVNNTGLIEVPMGTSIRTIVFDIGGGIPENREFKAVQTGGPSGGCIPVEHIDTPIDYESLKEKGSMMGSGGLIVMDETDCMVDIARFYLHFSQDESCGQCTPCRVGTKRMLEILERITKGEGTMEDLETLEELGEEIKDASLCGLGMAAPNPVLSTLRYFRDEYIAHIRDKKCPAGVCRALLDYAIDEEKCVSCGICAKACTVNAIRGEQKGRPYFIDRQKCLKCGACLARCPKEAIYTG
ncbi:4Fe-4S binding protein [Desulfallas sp. Bu1-1]|uniref:NADH-ubiquinone oxidoreductase-F iron-sulfur binding region domain-containing protein n=1 Tax=Desulfallas sp. Bu1-1 TaxID=2787620 RepID=UPI00189C5A33|nr:NADH-ubiquinone oxidoreductase-F iron-sulfur binding region domain-containing protein [Desulfallas sp. Bu1-1]MBF7084123.1 4Fe-4S binding protein [Desulfallas sp. Bu1-1]